MAADDTPSDAARSDDDDAAVLAAVCADAGGVRVRGDDRTAERKSISVRRRQVGRLAGARERQAGDDVGLLERQPGLAQRLVGRPQHLRKAVLDTEAYVGRTGRPLAADMAVKVDEPGTAARATTVNTKK